MSELISITVGALLEKVAKMYPDDQAVKYTDRPFNMTWRQFDDEVNRIAKGFLAMGIRKGDHVAIWATNVPEWLLTLFATAKIGAVLVTVNTNYKVFELEYLLRQSDSKALVMIKGFKDADYVGIVNELCPTLKDFKPGEYDNPMLPFLKDVVYVGEGPAPAGMYAWDDLRQMGDAVPEEEFRAVFDSIDPQEVVNMQYTSGTTGFPKGVMLTHFNIVNNGKCIGDCMRFSHDDKLCICVPFFHCFGLVLAVMAALTHATSMVPIETYRPTEVLKALQNEECTAVHGVPTMFIAMLEHPTFYEYKFPRLRTGGLALPDQGDAACRGQDGYAGNHDYIRPDGGVARLHDDHHRGQPRPARRDGGPRDAPCRDEDRRPRDGGDVAPLPAGRVLRAGLQRHARLLQDGGGHPPGDRRGRLVAHG